MATVDKLSPDVLGPIRQRLGAKDANDTSVDELINDMPAAPLFDAWCNWHGLINWGQDIRYTLDQLQREVEVKAGMAPGACRVTMEE